METLISELNVWHWLAIALILFGIEMMTGTFDLLMISIAAFVTAIYAFFAPGDLGAWQGQLLVFSIASVVLIVLGRTLFAKARDDVPEHPTLNKRMSGLIGQKGKAIGDFVSGEGRVKIGDTDWGAEAADGEVIKAGDSVRVDSAKSTTAIVRKV